MTPIRSVGGSRRRQSARRAAGSVLGAGAAEGEGDDQQRRRTRRGRVPRTPGRRSAGAAWAPRRRGRLQGQDRVDGQGLDHGHSLARARRDPGAGLSCGSGRLRSRPTWSWSARRRPIGPRACSFWVEMPISAPNPNSPPSVNRVEALTMTAAASTSATQRRASVWLSVTIASVWPLDQRRTWSIASSSESDDPTARSSERYSGPSPRRCRRRCRSPAARRTATPVAAWTVTPGRGRAGEDRGRKRVGDVRVHQQGLGRVADADPMDLRVHRDGNGFGRGRRSRRRTHGSCRCRSRSRARSTPRPRCGSGRRRRAGSARRCSRGPSSGA